MSKPVREKIVGNPVDERAPGLAIATDVPLAQNQKDAANLLLRGIEDDLLRTSLTTVRDALMFQDIPEDCPAPPAEWVAELGEAGAEKRLRLALAAWRNAKEAPVGLKMAKEVAMGIIKARSTEASAARMNVAVQIVTQVANYEVLEIEE